MNWLRNRKITQKIFLLIFISTFSLISVGSIGYYYMNSMKENSEEMYNDRLLPVRWLNIIRANSYIIKVNLLEYMLATDSTRQKELLKEVEGYIKESDQLLGKYESLKLDPYELENLETFKKLMEDYRQERIRVYNMASQDSEKAYAYFTSNVEPIVDELEKVIRSLAQYNSDVAKELNKQNEQSADSARINMLIIIVVSAFVTIGVSIIIGRFIANPLKQLQNLMGQAEKGDLTVRSQIQTKDETGAISSSFNSMISGFQVMVNKVVDNVSSLSASSEELSASSEQGRAATNQVTVSIQEIASGAENQTMKSEQSSIATNEMAVGIKRIAESSNQMNEISHETAETTRHGNEIVKEAITQINHIKTAVNESSIKIETVKTRSQEIESIVNVISDISSQTNLLALNAAIEAARAGENGRGFAVVADEVRKLAEQTSQSANEITELVKTIQLDTNSSVESMVNVTKEVNNGVISMNNINDTFKQILLAVNSVAAQIEEISATSQQLSAGGEQVSSSVEDIASIAKETSDMLQNVAASSEEQFASMEDISNSAVALSEMAQELQSLVSHFKC
ncbi:methyl-accepting chemotaxis protein [Bacillus timonensis]|nr:methyl-accepting chemotaxis protein [Bacillus timonensis]